MPDSEAPPALAPAPAPQGVAPARWRYVDAARTHEVHAGLRPGAPPVFVVRESRHDNDDPAESFAEETALEAPWEAQLAQWRLESRLAQLGAYWKHDARDPGWRALVRPQGAPALDLREMSGTPYRGRVALHHLHAREEGDVVLLAIPDATPRGIRYAIARATLRELDAEAADVRLLHARLPEAPARSLLAREIQRLRERGHETLADAADLARAHAEGPARALACYRALLERLSEGRLGAPARREAPIDPLYTDYLAALTDPRLLELHARYLGAQEQADALAAGAHAIRRLVAEKRRAAPVADQHRLSLLEASLLARVQLRPGGRVDPEVAALVRRFGSYL